MKEKKVQRQQMLQVEFQLKVVNTQQIITIIDFIHIIGVLHAITSKTSRIVRVKRRKMDLKCS